MSLFSWDLAEDDYNHAQLSANWQNIDFHDHSPGRGVQISGSGIAPGSIASAHLASDLAPLVGLVANGASLTEGLDAAKGAASAAPRRVWYQATWQQSVASASLASIFLNGNQLLQAGQGSPQVQEVGRGTDVALNAQLASSQLGLINGGTISGTGPDATTGQLVGIRAIGGGPCYVFAAAGTYTVSVQFKSSSGSVTASNRKLWVRAYDFA
jgi:hypothetical protein